MSDRAEPSATTLAHCVDDLSYDNFVRLQIDPRVPMGHLWDCVTNQSHLNDWWPGFVLEARPEGRFEEIWTEADGTRKRTGGHLHVFDPDWRLMLIWRDGDWDFDTHVNVELQEKPEFTSLHLVHTGWESAPEDDRRRLIDDHIAGWSRHLTNLCVHAERSLDAA